MSDITRLIEAVHRGESNSAAELLAAVYQELRRLAAHRMAGEASGHTLQPTITLFLAFVFTLLKVVPVMVEATIALNPELRNRELPVWMRGLIELSQFTQRYFLYGCFALVAAYILWRRRQR